MYSHTAIAAAERYRYASIQLYGAHHMFYSSTSPIDVVYTWRSVGGRKKIQWTMSRSCCSMLLFQCVSVCVCVCTCEHLAWCRRGSIIAKSPQFEMCLYSLCDCDWLTLWFSSSNFLEIVIVAGFELSSQNHSTAVFSLPFCSNFIPFFFLFPHFFCWL